MKAESIWKANSEHQVAQATGKKVWYADYALLSE
jgi:hypothetical protein